MAKRDSITRVGIYARVSTRDKGQDVENQLIQLREYCENQQWVIAHEYIDHDTAKHGIRDEYRQLFEDASRRKFNVVLVWALDRFTREGIQETFAYIDKLKKFGVLFESYSEPHFRTTGPAGELMLAVAAWIAKQERLRISERTKAGMERARRHGEVLGAPRKAHRKDRVLELHSQGLGVRAIARQLKRERGGEVSYQTIWRTIQASQKGVEQSA